MNLFRSVLLATLLVSGSALAEAPHLVNYQGRLRDSLGNLAADSTYAVTFSLYSVPTGGSPLWTEIHAITTKNGLFTTVLGATTPFGPTAFADSVRYLGTQVAAEPELSPRVRLASVPFALASNSGWVDSGTIVRLSTNTDYVGIGTATPLRPLHVSDPAGGLFVSRIESSNSGATVSEISNISSGSVWECSVAGSDGIPFWGVQPGDLYFYKQGTIWPNAVMTSGGSLGLGTSLPRARLEAVTLDTTAGFFLAAAETPATKVLRAEYTGTGSHDAIAVYGKSTPADFYGIGGFFEGGYLGVRGYVVQDGPAGYFGVSGVAEGNGTGTKYAVQGVASGSAGEKYGVWGQALGSDGNKYGVYGAAAGAQGFNIAVRGVASGGSAAVGGQFEGSSGVQGIGAGTGYASGTYGEATATDVGGYSYGLSGVAHGAGTNYAVHATAAGGTANWAGYFIGNVNINGTLSKSAGSFRIDHPLDPGNKYLQHSFVESPDMMNIYNGNVVTDVSGNATITLPDWFESLNKDFRYQLTVIGQFAQAIVSSKMSNNQFSIQTDKPNIEVSWQVTGIRKDAYAEAHRIEVEVAKSDIERGMYAHPELFGKLEGLGIDYRSRKEMQERKPPAAGDLTGRLDRLKSQTDKQ